MNWYVLVGMGLQCVQMYCASLIVLSYDGGGGFVFGMRCMCLVVLCVWLGCSVSDVMLLTSC